MVFPQGIEPYPIVLQTIVHTSYTKETNSPSFTAVLVLQHPLKDSHRFPMSLYLNGLADKTRTCILLFPKQARGHITLQLENGTTNETRTRIYKLKVYMS